MNEFISYMHALGDLRKDQKDCHEEWQNEAWDRYGELCARKDKIADILDLAWMAKRKGMDLQINAIRPCTSIRLYDTDRFFEFGIDITPEVLTVRDWNDPSDPVWNGICHRRIRLHRGYAEDENAFLGEMSAAGYQTPEAFNYVSRQLAEASAAVDLVWSGLLQKLDEQLRERTDEQEEDQER